MEQKSWQKVSHWLLSNGKSPSQLKNFQQNIDEVEKFFSVTASFPGWDQLTARDGSIYLTTLTRTLDTKHLSQKWLILSTISECLEDLQINNHHPFDPVNLFVASLKDERQYSPATIKAYTTDLHDCKTTWRKAGRMHQWFEIDQSDVSLYLMTLRKRHLKQTTILRKISSLRSFYQFLEENHLVSSNPWQLIVMKKKPSELPRYLYSPEVKALVQTAKDGQEPLNYRNLAIIEILLSTGMRVGELCALKISDIDTSLNIILINGKGGKQRYLPLSSQLKTVLTTYNLHCRQLLMHKYHQQHDFLIVNQYGSAITEAGITYILNKLISQSSLTGHIHPHMLRHTFATTMLNNGADIRSVQELLGHASLSTTQIYTHLTSKHLKDSYQRFFSRARKE